MTKASNKAKSGTNLKAKRFSVGFMIAASKFKKCERNVEDI